MSVIRFLALCSIKSSTLAKDVPPLTIILLNNLIPITRLDNSHNYVTFSVGFKETNGLKAALGITLSRAAATSFSRFVVFSIIGF